MLEYILLLIRGLFDSLLWFDFKIWVLGMRNIHGIKVFVTSHAFSNSLRTTHRFRNKIVRILKSLGNKGNY